MMSNTSIRRPWSIEGALIWLRWENHGLAERYAPPGVDPISIAGLRMYPAMAVSGACEVRTWAAATIMLLEALQQNSIIAQSPIGPVPQGRWMAMDSLNHNELQNLRFERITVWNDEVVALTARPTTAFKERASDQQFAIHEPILPPHLTLMQAVAWIVTRESATVLRASLMDEDNKIADAYFAERDQQLWYSPDRIGLDLLSVRLRALELNQTLDPWAAPIAAARLLCGELQRGRVTATAHGYDTASDTRGPRVSISALEWAGLSIQQPEDRPDELAVYVGPEISDHIRGFLRVVEWQVVLIDTEPLVAVWPHAAGLATVNLTSEAETQDWPEQARRWIEQYARGELGANRPLPKREQTINLCKDTLGITYRVARRAWDALPQELKRDRRQTDRALIGH